MTNNAERMIECLNHVARILEKRATDETRSRETRLAYDSALIMLLYALNEDDQMIAQFDY